MDESWFEGVGNVLNNYDYPQSFGMGEDTYVDYDDYDGDMPW